MERNTERNRRRKGKQWETGAKGLKGWILRAACAVLFFCQLLSAGMPSGKPVQALAGQMSNSEKGDSGSDIVMEEYGNGNDYTGWYTLYIKVVDDETSEPVQGILVTVNSKDKGDAGHGPDINGVKEYVTDEEGILLFRIYPGPVTYAAIVPEGQKGYLGTEQYIGAVTEDYMTVTVRLKKDKKTEPEKPKPDPKPDTGKDDNKKPDTGNNNNKKPDTGNNNNGNNNNKKPDTGNNNANNKKPDTTDNKDNNKDNNGNNNNGNNSNKKPGTGTKPSTGKNDKDKVTKEEYELPGKDLIPGTEDDVTVKPDKDKDGNNNSGQDKDGNVKLPDGGTVIVPTLPDKGDIGIQVPGGTTVDKDGTIKLPEDDQNTVITLPGKDTILGTEDDVTVKPSLDGNGKNNSSIDETGKVTLPDGGEVILPTLPDIGDIRVEVPGGTTVDTDGTITLPEGDQNTTITLPGKDRILDTEDDVTVKPSLDKNGKNNAKIDETGNVTLPDGGDVILPTLPDIGDICVTVPGGTTIGADGTITLPEDDQETKITLPGKDKILGTEDDLILHPSLDGNGKNNSIISEEGTVTLPDGGVLYVPSIPDQGMIKVMLPEGATVTADGTITIPEGTKRGYVLPGKDAVIDTEDDVLVDPFFGDNGCDNSVLREDGSVLLPDGGTVTYADGTVVKVPDGTIVLPDGTILYPDNGYIGFFDCFYHWIVYAALLLAAVVFILSMRRLKRYGSQIRNIRWADGNGQVRLSYVEEMRKIIDIRMAAAVIVLAAAGAAAAYFVFDGHCIADIPSAAVLVAADIVFAVLLLRKSAAYRKILDECTGTGSNGSDHAGQEDR